MMTQKVSKKNHWPYWSVCLFVLFGILQSCSDSFLDAVSNGFAGTINLSGQIKQENTTRANDYGFVTGDRMGIYIVDYNNDEPGDLLASGNRASNVLYTFDEEEYEWTAPLEIYWRDSRTPVDVYGYYPGTNYIADPTAYSFEVSWQQNAEPREGEISNYEASDLLWGKSEHVQPTANEIVIDYSHRLSGVFVTLVKGEGVTATEWEKLEKIVQVDNTIRTCNFNLQTAKITLTGNADHSIQMLPQSGDAYRAIVIPQTVEAGKTLISVTLDGKTYSHRLTDPMKYMGGKMHNFTITVNKSEADGEYTISVADGGITDWVNDESSHNFKQNQYVIINCPEPGKLKESIAAAGYDEDEMQNLKVTGTLNSDDVYFMGGDMRSLKHLNMADAVMRHCWVGWDFINGNGIDYYEDDVMPAKSFYGNKTIRSLVLPNGLKRIGYEAFREMELMNSTLIIPASVKEIDNNAFGYVPYNGVEMVLPEGLEILGVNHHCGWKCEFNLTDNIIEFGGIDGCPNFYGTFHIPSKLKTWPGVYGLGSDGSFDGEVEIPQGMTSFGNIGVAFKKRIALTIPAGVKRIDAMGQRYSSITFNDDLEEIGGFEGSSMPFQITLPASLRKLNYGAFRWAQIEGEMVIPEGCLHIEPNAFAYNSLTQVSLPSKLEIVPEGLFRGNMYTTVTIPKYVRWIGEGAFDCGYLQTVVCLAETPPTLDGNRDPFGSVFKDKCVLEVPEKSVELYRNTPVWNTFKNITPHRELAFNVPSIKCMDKGTSREGIVRSQGPWEVVECPDWITVSPTSSDDRKTEVTVTVKANPGDTREGRVVFRLKGYDYTTYTEVRQVNPGVKEEQQFTLQTATAGSRAIPIFIVGEGYDADDIASGKYLPEIREQIEHIFSIEPMKSHRDRFTVSTAIACSPESGIDGLRKFHNDEWWKKSDDDMVLEYAQKYGVGIRGNESNAMIVVLRNTNNTGANGTTLYEREHKGLSISWIGKSDDVYPFDQQGFVLREVVGTGFGKLGPEQVNHFTFMKACGCPGCNKTSEFEHYRELGWWQNVSISGKLTELPWYHLIFDEKYAQMVDAWEGGMNHSRGAYRSENQSVMGNQFIPYFNTISREIIYKRIMEASGGTFDFDTFKANDKIEFPE